MSIWIMVLALILVAGAAMVACVREARPRCPSCHKPLDCLACLRRIQLGGLAEDDNPQYHIRPEAPKAPVWSDSPDNPDDPD